jgi:hypothetical protein
VLAECSGKFCLTLRLCEGLEFEIRLTSGNDATERAYKITEMFFRKSPAPTKADNELQLKLQCPAKLLQNRCWL